MILSDKSIKAKLKTGEIVIDPYDEAMLQPASYDLHMSNKIMYFDKTRVTCIDIRQPMAELMETRILKDDESYILYPGDFILSNIVEMTGVDSKHVGRLEGKSSLARIGLIIHATAGFLDPGNCLRMTLEICNLNNIPIKIYPNMKIAQMAFEEIDQEVEVPYGSKKLNSKYFGDTDVRPSMMNMNFNSDGTEYVNPRGSK